MAGTPEGCRLCLDPFAENVRPIDSSELKEQMDKVFHFPIDPIQGCPNSVCQSCSYTISEFYKFSEKVRLNQEQLSTTDVRIEPIATAETKLNVKLETTDSSPGDLNEPDLATDTVQPKVVYSDESSDHFSEGEVTAEPYEPPAKRTPRKRKVKTESSTSPKKVKTEDKNTPKAKLKEEQEQEDKQLQEFFKMVCDMCGHEESNFHALHTHFRKTHGRPGYIICCNKKLLKRRFLLEHMTVHLNPNTFRCEICNKNYKSKHNLSLHLTKTHGSEDDRPFKCDQCTQSFAKKYMLRAHMGAHQKVPCPQCDKILASKSVLRAHILNMHSDIDRRMVCDTCGQEFLNKACFDRHVKEHMGIEVVKKLQCHICEKWLLGERGLHAHLQASHYETSQPHICDICHRNYPNSRALWSHKRVVHVEEKYECEFCGKKFKQRNNLKEHRTIHTGEVLYACEVCGVAKNSKANLYTHTKNNHPVEWAERKQKAAEAAGP